MNNDERGAIGKEKQEKLRGLPGMARKVSQEAKLLEQAAQRDEGKWVDRLERVRKIYNTATAGAARKIVADSPVLNDEDKKFMKEMKQL